MKKSKILVAFVLTLCLVFSAVPAFADSANVSINNMNIKVNEVTVAVSGESYTLENGSEVPYSLLYKGTTYLPMRKVGELVGKEIAYDHEKKMASIKSTTAAVAAPAPCTHTAIAGTKEDITFETNSLNIYVDDKMVAKVGDSYTLRDGSAVPFSVVYKGTTYLPMRKIGELVGKNIGYDNETKSADIRDKVAMYKENDQIIDMGLLANIKAVSSSKDNDCTTYYYDAAELNVADADIFGNNLLDNKYVLQSNIKLPELGEGANADIYYNTEKNYSVLIGTMTEAEPKDKANPKMLIFIELHPGKYEVK